MTIRLIGSIDDVIADSPAVLVGAERCLPRGQNLLGLNVQHRALAFVLSGYALNDRPPAARGIHEWFGLAENCDHGTTHGGRQVRWPGVHRNHPGGAPDQAEEPGYRQFM